MKPIVDSTQIELLSGWQELKDYLDVMESYIGRIQGEFENKLKKLAPAKQHDYLIENPDEYLSINQEFPRILHNSFFVSACSLLEYCLRIMCSKFKDVGIRISYGAFRGKNEKPARDKLLAKLENLGVPNSKKFSDEISNYLIVRNSIVHDNGSLKEAEPELISFAKGKGIDSSLTDEVIIVLTKQFCEEVIRTMEEFVNILYERLVAIKKQ